MSGEDVAERVPASRRAAVYALIVAVAVCGMFEVEWWPLTGWKLFSQIRTETVVSWRVESVDATGRVERLALSTLGRAHERGAQLFRVWEDLERDERQQVCTAWLDAASERDPAITGLQLVRSVERRHLDDTSRADVVSSVVRQRCGRPT